MSAYSHTKGMENSEDEECVCQKSNGQEYPDESKTNKSKQSSKSEVGLNPVEDTSVPNRNSTHNITFERTLSLVKPTSSSTQTSPYACGSMGALHSVPRSDGKQNQNTSLLRSCYSAEIPSDRRLDVNSLHLSKSMPLLTRNGSDMSIIKSLRANNRSQEPSEQGLGEVSTTESDTIVNPTPGSSGFEENCSCEKCVSQREKKFEEEIAKEGMFIYQVAGDGACLFRAAALQIYGDQCMHALVRKAAVDFIANNRQYFQDFMTENIDDYLEMIKQPHSFGDQIEVVAISHAYKRFIEIYMYSANPVNYINLDLFDHGEPPIRLSYHRNCHFNAIIDPHNTVVNFATKALMWHTNGVKEIASDLSPDILQISDPDDADDELEASEMATTSTIPETKTVPSVTEFPLILSEKSAMNLKRQSNEALATPNAKRLCPNERLQSADSIALPRNRDNYMLMNATEPESVLTFGKRKQKDDDANFITLENFTIATPMPPVNSKRNSNETLLQKDMKQLCSINLHNYPSLIFQEEAHFQFSPKNPPSISKKLRKASPPTVLETSNSKNDCLELPSQQNINEALGNSSSETNQETVKFYHDQLKNLNRFLF